MLDSDEASDEAGLGRQARALRERCGGAVLLKGGHLDGPTCIDVLVHGDGARRDERPRIATRNTHGTGCTLSAAIAAGLAHGQALQEAVAAAQRYLHAAIASADALAVGGGQGPVHHFHALWPPLS